MQSPNRFRLGLLLSAFVFFSGGHSTPDVTLLLVFIKNLPNLGIQLWVMTLKPLLQIFMYRGFGNVEFFCRCPDSCSGLNDVHSQFAGPFLQWFGQINPSDAVCC